MDRGNPYILCVRVLYCKLQTIGKKLKFPAYGLGFELPTAAVAGKCVTTVPV